MSNVTRRVIAVQTGARRNYAVPSILQQAGLLEAFYTDLCASAGFGALLNRTLPQEFRRGALRRLLNRKLPDNLIGKTQTFDLPALKYLFRQQTATNDWLEGFQSLAVFHGDFSRAMISKGVGQATHVFSMHSEALGFLEFARERKLKIIVEIYISPVQQHVHAETQRYAHIEPPMPLEVMQAEVASLRRVLKLGDAFVAPSNYVMQGLMQLGADKDKCYLVPYAVGDSWFDIVNHAARGRVLFVGAAGIRKGIHILGQACQKLEHRGYEFRVAGNVSSQIREHEFTRQLNFLGRVPRTEVQNEYARADVFVLPSLLEGSAEVTYEALAAGVPVVTTEASGSVVRDGVEGFIVPAGDVDALASRVEQIIEDRNLRERMAQAARERARDYTWAKYAERLLAVFSSV